MDRLNHGFQSCPVCGRGCLTNLLELPDIPVFVNVLLSSADEARFCPKGKQRIVQCDYCGFVFNCDFEPEKVLYGSDYHADRGESDYYQRHISHVLDFIESVKPLKEQRVLEVACGNGEFLAKSVKRGPKAAVGIDPSAPGLAEGPFCLKNVLFDETYISQMSCPADVLFNRHMIEHIQNPLDMLSRFHQALADDGILYLETPRLNWILENQAFFDFPYEHCAYYSDYFMVSLLTMAGFEIAAAEYSYDEQYFSICAKKRNAKPVFAQAEEENLLYIRRSCSGLMHTYTSINRPEVTQHFCTEMLRSGEPDLNPPSILSEGVYFWGAAAKGVMCANLLGNWPIAGFIDKNPYKWGKYIPGTGHLVLAPSQINYPMIKTVIVENDVYYTEIRNEVQKIDPRILTISLSELLRM